MAKIDRAAEKWKRKAIARAAVWESEIKRPETAEAYVKGIANFTGLPESTVAGSSPVKEYRTAIQQLTAEDYRRGVEKVSPEKWKRKIIEAFSH